MKNSKPLYGFLWICLFLSGCSYEDKDQLNEDFNSDTTRIFNTTIGNPPKLPTRSSNELIVEYQLGTTEIVKNHLRDKYNVIKYEKCDCTNNRIEKWLFDRNVDIEGRKGDIAQEGGVEGTDFQFFYNNENASPGALGNNIGEQSDELIRSFVKSGNSGITIAVLDTGINLQALPPSSPFLYQSRSTQRSCEVDRRAEISGWDFVNHDNDVYDDNGHGTIVTSIIKSRLYEEHVWDYKILPVKVFDHLGKGSTFDILCGYLYTVNKPEVSAINMSFGWYGNPSSLLDKFISENPDILHISSSGNHGYDNDTVDHYPSSTGYTHVLAIGSFSVIEETIIKSPFSNYGVTEVDFLSFGNEVPFYDSYGSSYEVSGTSYAAPLVTAKAAKYYLNGYTTPIGMVQQIRINGTLLSGESSPLPVYYGDRIIE
ncbi:S8 family peptidase [Aquimarina sp. 2201CG5-10]|uniref:S8 family peptidase n=1 Tax=Aquimarina callyspongiae TaxID=3098150 RepID=UPI002AB5ACE7|nr:S8 family serine peptidase [Aquimarina sp. 2201CG5-10]MDY8134897.1 S8 family serine peptidase [Aquimarina sp. 2201CG5-10]